MKLEVSVLAVRLPVPGRGTENGQAAYYLYSIPMKPTHAYVYTITNPDSRIGSVWNSHRRWINYSAPSSLVFMPIHISCSSAQNNVKLRYADVGNWWDWQQTPPQPPSTSLLDRYYRPEGQRIYGAVTVVTVDLMCWHILCSMCKNKQQTATTENSITDGL